MDYNNGNNNNNMNMGNPGMPGPGMPNPNMMNPGMGSPNMGNPNMGHPGMGNPNMGNPNMSHPGMGNPGMVDPRMGNPGMADPRMGNPGMANPGMGNSNMGHPGMSNPNMGRPGMGTPGMGTPGNPGSPGMQGPGMGRQNPGMPGAGRQGLGRFGASGQGNLSHADLASSRLAKEIEKSVNGDRKNEGSADRPGLRRAGRAANGPAFALPEGLMEGISGLSAYIFGGILIICLIVALAAYGKGHKGGSVHSKKASIPTEMFTYTGIFRNAYEAAASGTLGGAGTESGVLYNDDGTMVPAAPTAIGEETPAPTDPDDYDPTAAASSDDTASSEGEASSGNYGQAESYKELLDQLQKAIASGDSAFVASKMAYEDEGGTLKAFPQTVVDHFVSYMSTNTDKLSSLMTDLSSDKYSGQNNGEFIVKLPYIKFVVNMGYDNTTVAIPGFSEQVVNAGQSADIAPLMPCMYTLTISNPDWNDVVTRDIEANINESTISINIKP